MDSAQLDLQIAADLSELANDPLEAVMYLWPWGSGELAAWPDGPDDWQKGWLREWGEAIRARQFDGVNPVMPYRASTRSGHGVGKSALVGMIVGVILSTRPYCQGRVSANTMPQLETTTWKEIVKWSSMMLTRHWFRMTSGRGAMKIAHRKHSETWRVTGMAWDAARSAAFAGLHAATSSPFYIFDEASEIARIILETAQGGLTDGEPFFFMFSNGTQPKGFFYDSHKDKVLSSRYKTFKVNSLEARTANKQLLKEWIDDWGADSPFCQVRIFGEFPVTGDKQFIPTPLVDAAMANKEPLWQPSDPIIIGVDVARFGDDETIIAVRRGRDASSIPLKIIKGQDTFKTSMDVKKLAEDLLADAVNVDGGGIGGGVIDNLRNWGIPNVNEIHFGGKSPDADYWMMNTYMMAEVRKWLRQGGVSLWNDNVLRRQLTIRQYDFHRTEKITAIKIQSKEEMKEDADIKESPDRADAFGLTFAVPVAIRDMERTRQMLSGERSSNVVGVEYDRFAAR